MTKSGYRGTYDDNTDHSFGLSMFDLSIVAYSKITLKDCCSNNTLEEQH